MSELLARRWSPQQISRHLKKRFGHVPEMRLCHESIYRAIYRPGSWLMRLTPLAPERRSPLRTGRDHRRAQQHPGRRRARERTPFMSPLAVRAGGW